MRRRVARYVANYDVCCGLKAKHLKPSETLADSIMEVGRYLNGLHYRITEEFIHIEFNLGNFG